MTHVDTRLISDSLEEIHLNVIATIVRCGLRRTEGASVIHNLFTPYSCVLFIQFAYCAMSIVGSKVI